MPEVVYKRKDGYLKVDYTRLGPYLIEAVKELAHEVQALKVKAGID